MIYNVEDRPPIKKLIGLSFQILLSVFIASTLIARICGVNVSGALVGAGVCTLTYAVTTGFKSPMYISNSGAFVAPVLTALAMGGYSAVAIGGITSALVYCLFGFIFKHVSVDKIYKIFPKVLIGSVTMVIGLNLMTFIPTYIGDTGNIGVLIAFITMLVVGLSSWYIKGTLSMFPFLIGTLVGYIVAIPFGLVDFSVFTGKIFTLPTFAFTQWQPITLATVLFIAVIYVAYTISAMMECLSDHAALSNIIGKDLYREPGLFRIFCGEGVANVATSFFGGLGACSYGEGVACVGFSRCASIWTVLGAAMLMILLGFLAPIQEFIASIPSCVFAGNAMILYGFIAWSGAKQLFDCDRDNMKNIIVFSTVASAGVGGMILSIYFQNQVIGFSGTALALVIGVLWNIILKDKVEVIEDISEVDNINGTTIEADDGSKIELIEY